MWVKIHWDPGKWLQALLKQVKKLNPFRKWGEQFELAQLIDLEDSWAQDLEGRISIPAD